MACTSTYDAGSLKLWDVQLIGKGAEAYEQAASPMVSGSLGTDELAYHEFLSSVDPSPFLVAAREGLGRR